MTRPLEFLGASLVLLLIIGTIVGAPCEDPTQLLRGEVEMLRREVAAARSACTTEHAEILRAHDALATIVESIDAEVGELVDDDDEAARPVRSVYARYAGRR